MQTVGVVLMGGKSSRFGRPKAEYEWKGQSLAAHALALLRPFCDHLVLVARRDQKINAWGHDQVLWDDESRSAGPLRGIYQALCHFPHSQLLMLPCDAPWVHPHLLHALCLFHLGNSAAFECEGLTMPFPSLWQGKDLPEFEQGLTLGLRSPRQMLQYLQCRKFGPEIWSKYDLHGRSFQSANTPQELL